MAETGPFRIDGLDYETDANGIITRTEPARTAITANPPKDRIQRRRDRKQAEHDNLQEQIDELTAERDQHDIDLANLQTILDNAR